VEEQLQVARPARLTRRAGRAGLFLFEGVKGVKM